VNAVPHLKALFVETSFPSSLQDLANRSGHLTPNTLAGELAKVKRNGFPVLLYHLKPAHLPELMRELDPLRRDGVRVLAAGDEFVF
jgi:cAMP phosphodiesterase